MKYINPTDFPGQEESALMLVGLLKAAADNVATLLQREDLVNPDGTVRWRDVPDAEHATLWASLVEAHDALGFHLEASDEERNGDPPEASR